MPTTIQDPTRWNITVYHGDVWPAESFEVVDEYSEAVQGFTARMHIRKFATQSIPEKVLTDADGFLVSGNKRTFNTTVDIAPGSYVHDIQITLANGEVHTQYAGKVTVKQDVTRP